MDLRFRKYILAFLALVIQGLITQAQYTISGTVKDRDNDQLLPGAHIILEGTYMATISNRDGQFAMDNLKKGKYVISVSFLGYSKEETEVELTGDLDLDIRLSVDPIMQEEVIVMGTRAGPESPVTYSVMDKEKISRMNMAQDMPYIIQNTPSVVTTSDAGTGIGYTGLRIRGTDLTRINVTIDGVPLNDSESHGVWWVDLPDIASSLESIQVQRGVGTSTNGPAAFGASVNLQTQTYSTDPYAEVSASAGSFDTWKTCIQAGSGLIRDRWSFDARYSKIHSDGYIDRAFSDLQSYYFSGGYFSNKTIVKATVFSGLEKTYQAWDGVPGYLLDSLPTYNGLGAYYDAQGNLQYYDNQTDNYDQGHYQVYWAQQLGQKWEFSLTFHYTRGKGYYEEYKMDQELADYGLEAEIIGQDTITSTDLVRQRWLDNDFTGTVFSLSYESKKNFDLTMGGAFSYYHGLHYGEIIWSRVAKTFDKDYRWYQNSGRKNDATLYARGNFQVSPLFNLYADFQFRRIDYSIDGIDNDLRDISQSHFYNFFNPKIGATFQMQNGSRIYISFAVGNREPNRSTLIDANPEKPYPVNETLYDLEAGYEFNTPRYALAANLYYMDYRNQLVLTGMINDVGDPVMENVPSSYRTGLEVVFGIRPCTMFKWDLNATASINRIRDFTEYVDDWDSYPQQIVNGLGTTDIAFSPSFIGNSTMTFTPVSFLNIKLISQYVGSQFIDNTSSPDRKLDPYFVNDLLIRAAFHPKPFKELAIRFKVINLFNESYITNAWVYRYYYEGHYDAYDGFFPQAGIHFMAGLDLKF